MSGAALYSLSGTIMILGVFAMLYGMLGSSLFIFIEGGILVWLGLAITMSVWEGKRLEM